jgi:hypothetical protein
VKRTVLIAAVGVVAGSIGTMAVVYTVGRSSAKGTLHKHPLMKATAWASSKIAAKTFNPDAVSWES